MNAITATAVALLLLVVAACGDSGSPTTAPPAGDTTTSTTGTTSTVVVTSPDTTEPVTTVVVSIPPPADGPSLFPPEPRDGSDGANGSGCAPGDGALPDGVWAGFVRGHDPDGFDFDLACFYFGDIAEQKAAEEGGEAPGGHYVSNQNDALRRIDLDRATPVNWIVAPPDSDLRFETLPYADWVGDPEGYSNCPGEFCLVWLYVDGGEVTEITEQYLP